MRSNNSSRRVNLAQDQHATATKMEPDAANASKSNYNRYTEKQIERARRVVHDAVMWRREYGYAYDDYEREAIELARSGENVSTRDLLRLAHSHRYIDKHGKDATINANYCPVFARWLCKEHPEIRPYIKLRKCPVGWVMEHAE